METEFEKASYPSREEVEARAYLLWENDGRQQGRDWEYWLRAEEELRKGSHSSDGATKSAERTLTATPGRQLQAPAKSDNPRLNPVVTGTTPTASFSTQKRRSTTLKASPEERTTSKRRRGE